MPFRFPFVRRRGFRFLSVGPMVDGELELVEPAVRWIEPMLQATGSPACVADRCSTTTRDDLLRTIQQHPRGHDPGNGIDRVPAYTFWMRLRPERSPVGVPMAGAVSLRVGHTESIERYFGHIGYGVFPPARGQHYAERSTRLLIPLARAHGMTELWITCNPDNAPSRRTCERLGGELIEVVPLPTDNPLYRAGERQKCRYLVRLAAHDR
jgi:predicted acetyltransferase